MSHNMSLTILRDTTLEDVGVDDPTPTPYDLATASDEMRLMGAQIGPHVVVSDAMMGLRAASLAERLGRQAYVVSLSGVSDTYVVEAHGPVTRLLVHQNGTVVEDRGEPLAAEAALVRAGDLEDAHLAMVDTLAETTQPALWQTPFVALASDDMPF